MQVQDHAAPADDDGRTRHVHSIGLLVEGVLESRELFEEERRRPVEERTAKPFAARDHVNEAAFYILDGDGYEIHDGIRYDWHAGDIAIVHNNCVHQHFNASTTKPARALVIKTKPMYLFLNMLFQQTVEGRPLEMTPEAEGFTVREIEEDLNHPKGGY